MAAHPFDADLAAQPEPQRHTFQTVARSLRSGQFKLGQQVGVWHTFDRHGTLIKETAF